MAVTASMVKDLREKTGAGMLDCKKALEQADGDMEQAVVVLRERGLAKAAKKADRIAAEGVVATKTSEDGTKAVVIEINSETDFVAKNEMFKTFVEEVVTLALATDVDDVEAFLNVKWINDDSKTVSDVLTEKIAVIGEKLSIRRLKKVSVTDGVVVDYNHAGGNIGVLVSFKAGSVNGEIKEAGKNVAMQIAALTPLYVCRDEIPGDYVEKEREILKVQAKNENPDKPDSIIDKMIIGRLNKGLKEICLLDQSYVKDGDLTVEKYIQSVAKANNTDLSVEMFVRFECGEGIEKKVENFAEEVAKQMQQS
jgi:elongation factor Ts